MSPRRSLSAVAIFALVVGAIVAVARSRSADKAGDATLAPAPESARVTEPRPAAVSSPQESGPKSIPDDPVVVTVRVEHRLGTIPPEAQRARRIGVWFLLPHDHDRKGVGASGHIQFDGLIRLTADNVKQWERCSLEIDIFGFDAKLLERPRDPIPREVTVSVESSRPLMTFAGQVRDERGRPLAGAGVFLSGSWWDPFLEPAVRTAADGTFTLTTGVGPATDDAQPKPLAMEVVALGFDPASVEVRREGEGRMDIPLAKASHDGTLDLLLVAPDGKPAVGAHALVVPAESSFVDEWGWTKSPGDQIEGPLTKSRRRLARLLERPSFDSQAQDMPANGVFSEILDLKTEGDGHLRIDALPVGRYRVRAVLPARETSGSRGDWIGIRETGAESSVESTIDVVAPPSVSSGTVRFPPGRSVVGHLDVEVNPSWHCGRTRHVHVLRAFGWPWLGDSGVGSGMGRSGRFRLDGMPYDAFSLQIRTDDYGREMCIVHTFKDDHGELDVQVPAVAVPLVKSDPQTGVQGITTDLGDIVVPDVRVIFVRIVPAEGERLDGLRPVVELRGVDPAPRVVGDGGAFRITLARPPSVGAVLVVGRETDDLDAVRVPWPFELGDAEHPLVIQLPKRNR